MGPALRFLGRYVAVLAAAASGLLVLDSAALLLTGAARGVSTYRSVEEAERALGTTILLPAFFPDAWRWPPAAVTASMEPSRAVALTFEPRSEGSGRLLFVQTLDGDLRVPARLLASGRVLHEVDFDIEGTPARITDVLLPPDGTFHDLSLTARGRRVVFRFQGESVTILKMATSLQRAGAR